MAKMKKKAGEINSSSMADIAFLLLIFFLVTTTMDVDMGMRRVLPPAGNEEQKQEDIEIKERNILIVNISKSGKIMVGRNEYSRNDLERNGEHSRLSKETFDFLVDVNRSEKKSVEIEAGKFFNLSDGLVSLMADNETTYDVYLQVQDELTHAFNLYREYVSFEVYGKAIEDLDEEQQKNLRSKVPPKISEAKPFKANN